MRKQFNDNLRWMDVFLLIPYATIITDDLTELRKENDYQKIS